MSNETEVKTMTAVTPNDITQVQVEHWESPKYGGDNERAGGEPFTMEMIDHRVVSGQLLVNLAPVDGDVDDMLSAAFEVASAPGSNDPVQAISLYMDSEHVALRLYKQGNQVLIVPGNAEVQLLPTRLPDGGHGWILR
ncbi:hypothetical protein [Methylibium petroleiphilum]|uniref:Uncharacterized protein n=1 Tax=Methylibium petroleiphilum (strain ATCC BAA-1232 / LMG 22953 / PM1) TaxID=420662 RepID=A2SNM9_METPP|nr:hypothetical protein [Methylibium petroleiphilum]ABM97168.1 conserved hypothetical protein [Methylibium petroleiphilum PM1]